MPRLILRIAEELNMSTPMLLDLYGYSLMKAALFPCIREPKSPKCKEILTKNKVPV